MIKATLAALLDRALEARGALSPENIPAIRLFNGFYEGAPQLLVDQYAQTLVVYDYRTTPDPELDINAVQDFLLSRLPWITCIIQKSRASKDPASKQGLITFGNNPAQQIIEHGVHYALNLQMNQDASFYLDTRELRRWLWNHAADWRVLNTFAYTGSLGVAALAGGAAHVLQTDRSGKFLALARQSAILNHLDLEKMQLRAADFFPQIAQLKRQHALFDCVILDPPFFSSTKKGTIDLNMESTRLINKVRPLVRDGGWLVAINNALFLSGADYIQALEVLCADDYLSIDTLIPVPPDITGFPTTVCTPPPSDPAPFNHPTKIALLRVRRKDKQ